MIKYDTFFNANEVEKLPSILNLILSDRSDGKTFDIKVRGFLNYIRNNEQFIYLRRWKSEISCDMYENFYNEIIYSVQNGTYVGDEELKKILDYELKGEKRGVYIRKKGAKKWDLLCYFFALTMTSKKKSTLDITRISKIEYDEFIPLDGRYMKNEMEIILEFYKSVDRDRDKVKFNMYGNRVDNFNPFFDYFDIHLGIQKEKIKTYKNNTICVFIYANKEHRKKRKETRFNTLVERTNYEKYNIGGTLYENIIKIQGTNNAVYFASFKSCLGDGSIYTNGNKIIISSKQRKDGDLITDKIYNTGRKEYLVTFGNLPKFIKQRAKCGLIFYDKESTYHIFEPLLNKIGGL